MSLIKDEDDGAAEPLYTQSDDEHNYLKAKAVRFSDRKRVRFIWSFVAISYLILMSMYVKLWISFKEIESELGTLESEIFPCMDTMVFL